MKIQMPGTDEWKEIGPLVEVTSYMLNIELGRGTVFTSGGGIKIFLDQEDLDKITDPSSEPRKLF